jgi:sulfate permease, SulP family
MGRPRVLTLLLRNAPAIDATGLVALRDVVRRTREDGTLLLLSDVHAQPMPAIGRFGTRSRPCSASADSFRSPESPP